MLALTISQPYASLIRDRKKWVENRIWLPKYRGTIAIHAGSGLQYLTRQELQEYQHGCVIATTELVAAVWLEDAVKRLPDAMRELEAAGISVDALLAHKHTEGPGCLVLRNTQPIVPVYCRGKQKFWTFDGVVSPLESDWVTGQT